MAITRKQSKHTDGGRRSSSITEVFAFFFLKKHILQTRTHDAQRLSLLLKLILKLR